MTQGDWETERGEAGMVVYVLIARTLDISLRSNAIVNRQLSNPNDPHQALFVNSCLSILVSFFAATFTLLFTLL